MNSFPTLIAIFFIFLYFLLEFLFNLFLFFLELANLLILGTLKEFAAIRARNGERSLRGFVTSHADYLFRRLLSSRYPLRAMNVEISGALPGRRRLPVDFPARVYGFDDVLRRKFPRDRNCRKRSDGAYIIRHATRSRMYTLNLHSIFIYRTRIA